MRIKLRHGDLRGDTQTLCCKLLNLTQCTGQRAGNEYDYH